ncbi:MAG: chromate transporter [Bacillota bacterium]
MTSKKKVLFELFTVFAKIGTFAFGGGYVMVPMIQKEVSENRDWVQKDKIGEVISISSSMPGAIAMNTSVYVGYIVAGYPGAFVALAGCILPAIFLMLGFVIFLAGFQDAPIMKAALKGIVPVVSGLMIVAMVKLYKSNVKDIGTLIFCIISVVLGVIFTILSINVIYILLGCALAGVLTLTSSLSQFALTKLKEKK